MFDDIASFCIPCLIPINASVARWRFLSPDLVKSGENWMPLAISFYFWLQAKFWRFSGDFGPAAASVGNATIAVEIAAHITCPDVVGPFGVPETTS